MTTTTPPPSPENIRPENIREEAANTILAELLREYSLPARAERRGRRGAPDIQVTLKTGDAVLLECKWDDASGLLAAQLDHRRQNFPDELALVGVLYPARLKSADNLRAELHAADDLLWWTHGIRGSPHPQPYARRGSVADLADQLRALPLELEGVDRVMAAAGIIGHAVERAAQIIAAHAGIAHTIADIIAETDRETDRSAALRIGCLVLFNAMAFQERLAAVNAAVRTIGQSLGFANGGSDTAGLRDVWRQICGAIDYVPVFALAGAILDQLNAGPAGLAANAIAPLQQAVRATGSLEGHDLSGRLFHTLLTDAKFTGAYYTSVPAATLLARLVFEGWPPQVDWKDHEFPASLNVADLACGTGTLLMAVAAEAERRHLAAGGQDASALHKAMVEQAIHGYDVQLSAIHFAATSLAMLNPDVQFDRMNLYVMPLGASGDNVSLGSLDFLGEDEAVVQFALSPEATGIATNGAQKVSGSGNGTQGVAEGITARLPSLDLAIMNPPFTRTGTMLFGVLPATERRKLQQELGSRLRARQASATAGLGAPFVAAVAPKLRPGEGRLALVLPATVCTGSSWQQTRSLIERDFTLDLVIVSHDPTRWNFSDSTDLSEALLIATRRAKKDQSERRTTFVNLWQNPGGILDAHRMAQAIARRRPAPFEGRGTALLNVDGRHMGEMVSIPERRVVGRKWAGVQFARVDVIRSALRLVEDSEVWVPGAPTVSRVPLCLLKELAEVGPDRRRLIDGFERTNSVTAYPMVEGHNTEQRRSLVCAPNAYLAPLVTPRGGQRPGYGEQLWQQAARLLAAERIRLDTVRVVAMRSELPVLSNVWWEITLENDSQEKALAVWLNSSLGLLTIMAERTSTEGSWVAMKKGDLEQLPVLNLRALPEAQLQAMAQLFDQLAGDEFARLPAMAACPARRRLDEGIAAILSLPDLSALRRLLSTEPVVSNRRL